MTKRTTWNIVGTFEICGKEEECLVYACHTKDGAEKVLEKMLANPTENDLAVMKDGKNFRIHEEEIENCWWLND